MGTRPGIAVSRGGDVFATPPEKRGTATRSLEYLRVRTVSANVARSSANAGEGQRKLDVCSSAGTGAAAGLVDGNNLVVEIGRRAVLGAALECPERVLPSGPPSPCASTTAPSTVSAGPLFGLDVTAGAPMRAREAKGRKAQPLRFPLLVPWRWVYDDCVGV
jgi:hypothetical protein